MNSLDPQAIIVLSAPSAPSSSSSHSHASAPSLPLTAHFTTGGRPIMFHLPSSAGSAGAWEARWVVATTDYDSGGGATGGGKKANGAVKREKSESVAAPAAAAAAARKNKGKGKERALFNPPATPAPQQRDDEEDMYGGGDDLGGFEDAGAGFEDEEAAWAEIDRLSQMATQQQQSQRQGPVPRDASVASQGGVGEEWEFDAIDGVQASAKGTQLGPTQKGGGGGKAGGWGAEGSGDEEDERAAKKVCPAHFGAGLPRAFEAVLTSGTIAPYSLAGICSVTAD